MAAAHDGDMPALKERGGLNVAGKLAVDIKTEGQICGAVPEILEGEPSSRANPDFQLGRPFCQCGQRRREKHGGGVVDHFENDRTVNFQRRESFFSENPFERFQRTAHGRHQGLHAFCRHKGVARADKEFVADQGSGVIEPVRRFGRGPGERHCRTRERAFLGKEQQERQVVVGEVVGEFGHREAALCLSEKENRETVSSLVRRNGFPILANSRIYAAQTNSRRISSRTAFRRNT